MSGARCGKHIDFAITGGKIACVFSSSQPIRAKVLAPTRMVERITQVPQPPPSWIQHHSLASKASAVEKLRQANREMSVYNDLEALLWRRDRFLVIACCNLLREMGFKVEYKEEQGDHDLEISDGDYFAIAEVTGSEHQIRIANADSLSRYYMKLKYDDNKRTLRALLIGNAFHQDDLANRKLCPFSDSLVKAIKNEYNYISLISTVDLYRPICRMSCREIACTSRSVSASDAYSSVDQLRGDASAPSVAEPQRPRSCQLKAFLIASALSSRLDGAHFGGICATSRIPAFSNFSKCVSIRPRIPCKLLFGD